MLTLSANDIIYEDSAILVCRKAAGLASQTAKSGQPDLVSLLKTYRVQKKEPPYIGLVHRLDQPVCGLMVFAKTKQAAAHLSKQVSTRQITKEYLAVVCGIPSAKGELCDFLLRDGKRNTSRVVSKETPGAKEARLSYTVVCSDVAANKSLVHIVLHTGRHHQIRVQFSHAGFPLYADTKYGQPLPKGSYCPVALCSYKLTFVHPTTKKTLTFTYPDAQSLWDISRL